MSLLADRFPSSRLGFASGVYYMGVPVGVAASLIVVAYLEPILGWRGCFYALGGAGVLLAIVMLFIKETPRKHEVEAAEPVEKPSAREIMTILLGALRQSPALTMTIGGGAGFPLYFRCG